MSFIIRQEEYIKFDLFVGLKVQLLQYKENDAKTLYIHYYVLFHSQVLICIEVNQSIVLHSQTNYPNLLQFHKHLQFLED